jgi:hypothetical protein
MANYRAIANGNWSNLAIWQDDRLGYFSASVSLPTTADDVYANNFTVTIDGTRNAFTIRNTAFTPPTNLGAMSIPQMTSNTTPSGAAAASGAVANGPAWNAFDRNTGTTWNNSATGQTGWLSYQFTTGRIIKRYGFFSDSNNARNPRTWTFEGSNNGSTWVTLDTQTAFVTGGSTFYSFDISANTTSYTYYRINVTATQGGTTGIAIVELEMSEVTNLYGGIVVGGGFTFANGGNLTCTASNSIFVGSTTATLTFDLPSGQSATFNGSVNLLTNISNYRSVLVQNTGTFNMVGNYDMSNGTSANRHIIFVNGSAIINTVGNITSSQTSSQTSNQTATTLFVNAGNPTINITGNVTGSSVNSFLANYQAIFCSTTTTLNITGNITTNSAPSIWFNTSGTLNLIGNATGGNAHPAVFNANSPATIDILGTTTSGSGYPAIQGLATTFVIVRGNVVHTDTYAAIYAGRIVINDNVTSWQFKDSTNTITRTLYTPGVPLGNPATSNVRNGVTYGPALELTGTAFIPTADNVRKGVPVDATIGTADLTAADMWNYLASNITTAGSIGEAILDIKTKTDLIPNNPASVDAVGAIVASYNV